MKDKQRIEAEKNALHLKILDLQEKAKDPERFTAVNRLDLNEAWARYHTLAWVLKK